MSRLRALVGERRNVSPANAASWLVALLVLAVAIPANDKIGKNAVFFAAHSFSPIAWIMLLIVVLAVVWLALWAVLRLVRAKTKATTYDVVATLITFVLTWFLAGNALALALAPSEPVLGFTLGLFVGLLVTWLARNFAMGTILLGVSAIAMAVPLVSAVAQEQQAQTGTFAFAADAKKPNVVWIVSDELSYPLIFDADGKVRDQFPNLKELQGNSTTYTHAYTAANHTDYAVPSQLSGISDVQALSSQELQTMRTSIGIIPGYAKDYTVFMQSPMFHFDCQDAKCAAAHADTSGSFIDRAVVFVKDAGAIAGNTALAQPFVNAFPSLDGKWRDYWNSGEEFSAYESSDTVGEVIDGLNAAVANDPTSPVFALWHSIRTHGPWVLDGEGEQIFPARVPIIDGAHMVGERANETDATDELASMDRRLYVYAAQDMDRQVGELIDELKALGKYDDTMIVFTSDHGVAITKEQLRRVGDNDIQRWSEIAHVPLMIKGPGQTGPEVVTAVRSTGQIAQTVLETTGAQAPAGTTQNLSLAHDPTDPPVFSTTWSNGLQGEAYPDLTEIDPWQASDLQPDPQYPFAIGIAPSLLGKPVPANAIEQPASLTTFPGQSTQQLIVAHRDDAACSRSSVGLVTTAGDDVVIGSVLWEGANGARGWAIVPKSSDGDYRLWCTPAA